VSRERSEGFTYIGVLVLVAVLGLGLAVTGELWHTVRKREKEAELIFIGEQFRAALTSYYETSGGARRYPQSLAELTEDRRGLVARRHLRKMYRDPMTGKAEWGVVKHPDGGIVGVHSLSADRPLKTGDFAAGSKALADAARYSEWVFRADDGAAAQ
jgi:type II secretory pathway pseudopilin PulG